MKRKYITSSLYTALDWHDMATVTEQEKNENGFTFENPEEYIAVKIYKDLVERIPEITVEEIKNIMSSGEDKTFDVKIKREGYINETSIKIYGSNSYGYHIEYAMGFTAIQSYRVYEVDDEDLGYLVSEHIVNAGKGCDLLERCYHELFTNYGEAEEYRLYMQSFIQSYYREGSGFKICICSRKEMEKHQWYKNNMRAMHCINNMGGIWTDYRFYNAKGVQVKYYEWLMGKSSEKEKEVIDKEVYITIFDLLPLEDRDELNVSIDHAKSRLELRDIVDKAILRCFALCQNEDDFDKIYEKLDVYAGRIEDIGKKIQHSAPEDCKYFVISKKGEVRYYKFEQDKDAPFWQPKEPFQSFIYTTKCMDSMEYHHLFVDEFPEP